MVIAGEEDRPTTYIDTLKRDTGALEASEIAVLMADKRLWKDLVVARLRATKWVCEWEFTLIGFSLIHRLKAGAPNDSVLQIH